MIKTGTIDLSSGAATIETALNEPGMVYVRLEPGNAVPAAPAPSFAELAQANTDLHTAAGKDPAVAAIFQRYPDLRLVAGAPPPSAAELDRLTVGAAVAPEKFQPSLPRPADFDSFWAGKLKALAAIPINPVLARRHRRRSRASVSIPSSSTASAAMCRVISPRLLRRASIRRW